MDIDLKCSADIRMTQHLAQALYIYPTLHTAGGVCVPQRVKISVRDTRCFQQSPQLPTRTQLDDLLKAVRHLEQMTEQAGKPKESSFSLHRIRLPRLHLPHVSIPALISLLMAAAALLLLWWGLGTVWSSSSLLGPVKIYAQNCLQAPAE